ncbi:BatD family protein [Shimia marina]|uniref:Oxygen tolerance n=1 Tax=Shimia marina TaxID=321267 RepID=A0A0P1EVY4_9RHOB|nr:BatD family protein [Shimia marina]CUH54368.1 hypothetical protein SHM7688_03838 [Shimia marina]SFE01819.1 Oxygen tolerance [Shimia marina]
MTWILRCLACLVLVSGAVFAQEQPDPEANAAAGQAAQAQIEVQFEKTETVPGQPLTLRLTVFVPTFMPDPPIWPDFESANLLVQLPKKASTATSKTVGGETWSGITRRYQITPLVPGTFTLPASDVQVRYQAESGSDVIEESLAVPEITLTGVMPEGAESLDPFVAANGLKLSQKVEGTPEDLKAGDSFTRVVTAEIDGVTPMFLPSLVSEEAPGGLRAYPETPQVEEKEDRGLLSGLRTETVVYVAEGGVDGVLPEITLRWYNLKTQSLEEATLPEIAVKASAPLVAVGPEGRDYTRLIAWVGVAALLLVLAFAARIWLAEPLAAYLAARRQRHVASARYAWKRLQGAVKQQDLLQTQEAFALWRARVVGVDPAAEAAVTEAFFALGRGRYGRETSSQAVADWRALEQKLHALHGTARYPLRNETAALKALNPVATQLK